VQTETATQTLLPEDLVQQFAVMLHNRSGAMGSLLKLLKSAHIETLGFSAQDSQDLTILRLVTSDPEETRSLFLEKGIPHTMSELLVVAFRNPDDELPKFLQALLAAETNINFSQLTKSLSKNLLLSSQLAKLLNTYEIPRLHSTLNHLYP